MELSIRKFELIDKAIKIVKETEGDILGDLVVAMEVGFVDSNKKIHSHSFCFHYLIDKYEGESNISFMILDTHQQTGQYCFWDYEEYNYKEKIRSKSFQIENAKLKIPKVQVDFEYQNKSFSECVELIKKDLWNSHERVLSTLHKEKIGYDSSMDLFSKELKEYINISYQDLFTQELASKIKEYEAHILDSNLSRKEIKNKKIKI